MLLLKRGLVLAAVCLVLPSPAGAEPDVGATVARLDVPGQLRAVSYYPADAGWTQMWEHWRPERIAADLSRLRGLNANTVRVVVPAHFFGYPRPAPEKLRLLRELVGIAASAGLHVHLTLFDWWDEYRDIEGSKRWARAVLTPYVGDRRIAFVELKNELDTTDRAALQWTRELVPWLRSLLRRQTPVTVSVGGTTPARRLRPLAAALPAAARPDFFIASLLHRRRRSGRARLRDAARPGRPDTAVDRRARLPDVHRPNGLSGSSTHAVRPGSRSGALLQALLRRPGTPRSPGAGALDPGRLRRGRDSGLGRAREGDRVPVRPLS